MTQDEALQLLSARIDGELTREQDEALDAWLRDNPDGQLIAEAFRSLHADMQKAFVERRQSAARTAERVIDQLPPMPASSVSTPLPRSRWRHLWSVFPPIAAAAALAFVSIALLRPETPLRTTTRTIEVVRAKNPNPADLPVLLVAKPKPTAPTAAAAAIDQLIQTGPGEKRREMLPDGSVVYLDQETKLKLEADRRLRLTEGRVYVEAVSTREDAAKGPFVLWTDKRKVEALGTKFSVTCGKLNDTVLVTNGAVKVEGADQPVQAGQILTTTGTKAKIESAPRADHELGWVRDLMVAADVPLVPSGKYDGGALVAVDPYGQEAKLSMVKFHVDVYIEDGFARTTIDQTYFNHETTQMEGTFYFPLPPDASLSRLAMYVADGEQRNLMEGGMAERDIARQTYERIRHARRDPALLEWVDGSLFKMRVFPLEPRQEKRLILSYSQKLPVSYGKTTYRFPAGHSLNFVDKWSFAARVKNGEGLQAVSPSHPKMKTESKDGDLLLTDKANRAKVDKDVVLELIDAAAVTGESVRWSSADFEGNKYLMLRYKPELPSQPRRERRDWVFLFEASGARDPLLARAQIEVVRALLTNAEHDDTFALLTTGTRVHALSLEPQPVSTANVEKAVEFLEKTHLIGALNIEQGLIDAERFLKAGTNPHLVHVGGGVATLGEQRADKLIERIPTGTRYVGVAVGKRFSPAFMKTAAEKTGGYFTQINPDEPIAWKGFELSATLNTPRLLNITVSAEGEGGTRFLTFDNALSQGDELAAVTRFVDDLPKTVRVHGSLNGVAVDKSIPVENVAPNAGYLPRTWAKLEIDRLLAEDARKHRQRITDLSKAMYVMTPFTSLLVLENEAMYKEHNIDRGRKDHWALYACPNQIPIVYIPDPNKPLDRNAPELREVKPHANQVAQTVLHRQVAQYLPAAERNGGRNVEARLGEVFIEGDRLTRENLYRIGSGKRLGATTNAMDEMTLFATPEPTTYFSDFAPSSTSRVKLFDSGMNGENFGIADRSDKYDGDPNVRMAQLLKDSENLRQIRVERDRFWMTNQPATLSYEQLNGQIGDPTPSRFSIPTGGVAGVAFSESSLWSNSGRFGYTVIGDGDARLPFTTGAQIAPLALLSERFEHDRPELLVAEANPGTRVGRIISDKTSGPRYYSRPSFSNNGRVFTDLAGYAPGMRSGRADLLAVIEAEAAPRSGVRKGMIDPDARKRIESARATDWHATAFRGQAGDTFVIQHDGQGRYFYERKLELGLIEKVVCDGTTLYHLYPELGIGAKRTVSRFHRAEFCSVIPDLLPPADDLAWHADVRMADANTVAIVPLQPAGIEEANAQRKHVELHLVFNGNRLAQRRWLLMPEKKLLGSEHYEAAGAIYTCDKDGKETTRETRTRKETSGPALKPDLSQLVVLPLPLRSREITYRKFDMIPHGNLFQGPNACFEFLPAESALELLACEFGHDDASRVLEIVWHCFLKKGDRRVGFYTLVQSCGYSPMEQSSFRELLDEQQAQDRVTPLMRYLALANDHRAVWMQQQFGLLPGSQPADDFLSNLLAFRMIAARWQSRAINDSLRGVRASERERALAFCRQHAGDVWGWCALSLVADAPKAPAEFRRQIADVWGLIAENSGLKYHARYEQAVNLLRAGDTAAARNKFQKLFEDAFAKGVLPPIDQRFRDALGGEAWTRLIDRAVTVRLEKKQFPAIVLLAAQCRQLGDLALADDLLERALKSPTDEKERLATNVAAIEYLWSIEAFEYADRLVGGLAATPEMKQNPGVWRLASKLAERRGRTLRQFECLETALDLEYAKMPEVFSVEPIRNDYRALLDHYQWLADASRSLDVPPPADLASRTIRAADRWRSLDPEVTQACDLTAKILRTIGGREIEALAWDYWTTPLALKPNESDPWLGLAESAVREGNLELADRCYEAAFAAEPTNAQILWDRAKLLERRGEIARGRELMKQLAATEWQPRFDTIKSQAKTTLEGR